MHLQIDKIKYILLMEFTHTVQCICTVTLKREAIYKPHSKYNYDHMISLMNRICENKILSEI